MADFKSANVMIVPREDGSARAVVTDLASPGGSRPGRGQTLLSHRKAGWRATALPPTCRRSRSGW